MTNSTKPNKGKTVDQNSVVKTGDVIPSAFVLSKLEKAVVLAYTHNGRRCTGVMHVSQFPSLEIAQRDQLFAQCEVNSEFYNLHAEVEPADKSKGRRFTSVRLSGRAPLEQAAKANREQAQVQRRQKESAHADAVQAVQGKVVQATIKSLAFSKVQKTDPETKKVTMEETDHCYGAFLKVDVDGVEVSGLLHTSRMTGQARVERLLAVYAEEGTMEVVATLTDKGLSFSEQDVQKLKEAAQQQTERESFLSCVREALANGTADKMQFPAKVTDNRLQSGGGVSCVACGVRVEVSSEDLSIPANNMRGNGHNVKLVPISVEGEVIKAKRFVKSK